MKQGAPHESQLARLNRIEGQVRGIARMIEERRYCIDIVTQLKAVIAALKSVELSVIEQHMQHCVHKALSSQNEKDREQSLEEILTLLKSSMRS